MGEPSTSGGFLRLTRWPAVPSIQPVPLAQPLSQACEARPSPRMGVVTLKTMGWNGSCCSIWILFFFEKILYGKTRVEMKPRYKSVFFLWILKLLIVEFLDDLKVTQMPFHRICGQLLLLLLLLLLFLVLVFFFFFFFFFGCQAWMIPMVMGGAVDWRVDNWKVN